MEDYDYTVKCDDPTGPRPSTWTEGAQADVEAEERRPSPNKTIPPVSPSKNAQWFRENYDTLIREVAFETLTGKAVLAFMRDRRLTNWGEISEERDVWRGTMSALYEEIKPKWLEVCDGSTKQRNLLPGSPARLTNAIDAIASSLVANGIVFTEVDRMTSAGRRSTPGGFSRARSVQSRCTCWILHMSWRTR